jgi:hypothetical protein
MKDIEVLFLGVSILSPLVTILVGYKSRLTLLWLYVATGLVFDIAINVARRVFHVNHFWLANLYVLSEFILISFIYKEKLYKNRYVFLVVTSLLPILFIGGTVRNSIWSFNTNGASIFYIVYIVYALLGFYTLLKEQRFLFLENSAFFWMNVAFLLYGSSNFILFLFTDYLRANNDELFKLLWSTFFLIINTLVYVLLAVALTRRKLPDSEYR